MSDCGDDDMVGVGTEIKSGVSTGKSIPHRLKFSSLSQVMWGDGKAGRQRVSLTDRQKVSKSDEILRVLRHCWNGQDSFFVIHIIFTEKRARKGNCYFYT